MTQEKVQRQGDGGKDETTTSAPATAYDDITTNVLSLGTGKGAAAVGRVPPGSVIAGLFFSDRNIFRRVERGLAHPPRGPNRGAAVVVVPQLVRRRKRRVSP